MRSNGRRSWGIGAALIVSAGMALGQTGYFQAPLGPGGTWNVYQINWDDHSFAEYTTTYAPNALDPVNGTLPGHLATMASQTENDLIWRWSNGEDTWIGLCDRFGVGAASESRITADPLTMGWAWITGEAFSYNHWPASGEPNDWNAGVPGEDAAHIRNDGFWNDNKSGYGPNLPADPGDGTNGDESGSPLRTNGAIEWEINSPTPIAGIRSGSVFGDLPGVYSALPGPAGGVGTWGIREIRNPTQLRHALDAVEQARSGAGTITDGSFGFLDTTDPDSNANPAGSVPGYAQPFLTDTVGVGDDNIITVAHGKIQVTTPGQYTFQVRSDDGFTFRIPGQNIQQVHGGGRIDLVDPQAANFWGGTGDADTRIVYNLAAGSYDVEFVHFEMGGGAYYEVTSAQGAIANSADASWIRLGDGATSYAPTGWDPAQLAADVTWYKSDVAGIPDPGMLAATISTMDAAVAGGTYTSTGTHPDAFITEGDLPDADDNYYLRADGEFTVDDRDGVGGETFQVTFGLRSDDGSAIHIVGQNFTGFGGNGAAWGFGSDTGLGADIWTGDAAAVGSLSLTEGVTYSFQAYQFEGGGGADMEIQVALGAWSVVEAANLVWFPLDQSDTSSIRPANAGLALVPEPATGLMALLGLALLAGLRRTK